MIEKGARNESDNSPTGASVGVQHRGRHLQGDESPSIKVRELDQRGRQRHRLGEPNS